MALDVIKTKNIMYTVRNNQIKKQNCKLESTLKLDVSLILLHFYEENVLNTFSPHWNKFEWIR